MIQTSQKPIGLAFLGCGFAAGLHSKTLARLPNIRRFYASRDPGKAVSFNKKYRGRGALASYEAAMQSHDVDAVVITTPPSQHLELALQALNAGKHVIVEKPPFLHAADFDDIRFASRQNGKRVLVAENYFYKPLLSRLRRVIQDDLIGDILFIHINALKKQRLHGWRADLRLSGGGALFEGGIHWINFIASLGMTVKSACGFQPRSQKRLEQSALVTFEFEEGPVATLLYSWEAPSIFKGLRISRVFGKQGSITFESNGVFIFVRGKKVRLIFPGFRDIAGYRGMFEDFIECIARNREPRYSLDLAERDMRLIESIYQSMESESLTVS